MVYDLTSILIQLLSGLSRAMMLFLLASGLSLIFGVMNILNFAHATLWMLAGYLTFTLFQFFNATMGESGWWLLPSTFLATMVLFALGCLIELVLIRRMYNRELPEQLLLTFALILIIGDVIKMIWGVDNLRIYMPIEPVEFFDSYINPYSFIVIGVGTAVAAGLWWFLHHTRYGKTIRAAVHSREMVSALGIRIGAMYTAVFGLGVAVAAMSAGVFLPIVPIGLGIDMDLIVQCFAVVVIGGFGSILGTFVASIIVGVVYSFSVLIWPDGALAIIFVILVSVLIWRPWGLFGTELRS